jgi:hypothetical protein
MTTTAAVPPDKGAYRDRHGRSARDAMDAAASGAIFCATSDVAVDGEVVWSWRSDAGAKVAGLNESDDRRWQPSMVTEESTKDTVKTIVQGMPAVAVYPWLLTRVLFAAHAASGATRIRHSLRPCLREGGSFPTTRTFRAARTKTLVSLNRHAPRKRGTQYAAAPRLKHKRLWDTGSPGPVYAKASTRPRVQGAPEL